MGLLRSRARLLALVGAGALIGVTAGLVGGHELSHLGQGASTTQLTWLYIGEDRFRNYDFNSQLDSATNVDWPITILFWNNAEVDKVKDFYRWACCPYPGGAKYAYLNEGFGDVWDSDAGQKGHWCPVFGETPHMRFYADSDDTLYNIYWGYYVLASTHYDVRECGFGKWHGDSERAEEYFVDVALFFGYAAQHDWAYFWNYEPYREEGNHFWDNNGWASAVNIP
ncbi:MAG TPA: hypothetical protein VNL95_09060 [Dehalococcoidia bacterium]|nr:hypothetical protein [Dehalococcoidia bacterium]